RAYAALVKKELERVPALRDLQYGQAQDYPTVRIDLDRERLGQSGVTVQEVSRSVLSATSSSRLVVPNYWADPKSGIGYQVQVQVPPNAMNSADQLGQTETMRQMFGGLASGLALAVVAVFILLTAYFQSPRLALTAVAAVPAVLVGVAVSLWLTHTTLNIQSFMGAIMSIGVAVANA